MGNDIIIKGLLYNKTVNLIAISGTDMVDSASNTHELSRVCTAALGRALLQVSMMSAQLKSSSESITATISGNGAAGKLVVVGSDGGIVKGYIDNPLVELPLTSDNKLDVSGAVGKDGELLVIRDLSLKEPYIGRSKLVDGEIANDFANYFYTSEQQPSLVYLGVHVEPVSGKTLAAAGLMLQPLPDCPTESILAMEEKADEISMIAQRLSAGELLEDVLESIFVNAGYELTQHIRPAFRCDCNRKRLEQVLISLGTDELNDILLTDRRAEIVCRFCNTKYQFNEDELRTILNECTDMEETKA